MRKILFVDDEPNVLRGLQDALRRRRKIWDMVFVSGGQEALEELGKRSYDVIVSDMKMPGMDGAQLLSEVRRQFPAVTRIVLSGHSEPDQLNRASRVSHQFLSKPCDPSQLQMAIERLISAREGAGDQRVWETVGRLLELPCIDAVRREILIPAESPGIGTHAFSALLERDDAVLPSVLQIANSTIFGDHSFTCSAAEAVERIGILPVKSIVLLIGVFREIEKQSLVEELDKQDWQRHVLLCARLAMLLADRPLAKDDSFVAGLLHDVGSIALALLEPAKYAQLVGLSADGMPKEVAEKEVFGFTHSEIGAYFLACCGFGSDISRACRNHHAAFAGLTLGQDLTGADVISHSVWLANEVAERFECASSVESVSDWLQNRLSLFNSADEAMHKLHGRVLSLLNEVDSDSHKPFFGLSNEHSPIPATEK